MPQGPSFWFDSHVFLAVAAALLIVIGFYNQYVAVLGAILLGALYMYGRKRYARQQKELSVYLNAMTHNIDQTTFYALQNLPVAIALVDKEARLHWFNQVFADWMGDKIEQGQSVLKMWPEMPLEQMWEKSGQHTMQTAGGYYQIIYKTLADTAQQLMILYITDITSHEKLRMQCTGAMPVMAHIQIDNYDDVLHGLNENQRTALLSEVTKYLAEWVAEHGGFIKKYAEDMYWAVFNRHALEKALQEKFDILDKIRAIRGGNKIPITLSMGVAADEDTIGALAQRSQAGLDLALGRGGDQATVHIDGKVQFYGGKAKAIEKNTRVKARIIAQAIRESMDDAELVLVMGHTNEDFDSLGASLGVAKMARYLGKKVHVIVSQPGAAVNKLEELLLDYDEYQSMFITPAQAVQAIVENTMLFVVDTHRPGMTAAPDLLQLVDKVVVIDHHRRSENFIANPLLAYLEPSASSSSELVTELLMYFDDKLDLSRLDASALYAGIVVDTKNFAVQVGVRTFDAAAYLRRAGADPVLVRQLFRLDFETMRSRAEIINNSELLPGGLIVATCPENIKNAQVAAAQAADMLLRIDGVRLSIVLFAIEDGVGVSARSQGDVNVQVLMEQLGGGGHQTVAGAQVKNAGMEEVKRKVIELSANYLRESEQNEINSTTRS